MARTERESDRRRREEKWQTCWCCRDQQRACRMALASAEKLEHTGPAEKKRVASVLQREQLTRTPEPSLPKGKGTDPMSRVSDHEGGESQDEREPHLGEASNKQATSNATSNKSLPRAGNKSLSRTSRRKHDRVSGRKSSPGRSAETWFHSKSGQT